MTKNIYKEIQSNISHKKLFNECVVQINICPAEIDSIRQYKITNIESDLSNSLNERLNEQVDRFVEELNNKMNNEKTFSNGWRLFYLIKEILQKFVSSEGELNSFNYFRGQACDWELVPGIFRNTISTKFIENFETIYKNISLEYPAEVQYVEYSESNLSERAKQLSVLQHYGLSTSLIDITKNPYIALLFMISDSSKKDFNGGTIDLYKIDEDEHAEKNIFMPIEKSNNNKRLTAQKGAFFNYDKLYDLKETDIDRIDRLILKISYSPDKYKADLCEKIKGFTDVLNDLGTDSEEENVEQLIEIINEVKTQYEKNLNNADEIGDEIFDILRQEIKTKLEEYFYFERNLFPDLDKYIEYVQSAYKVTTTSRQQLTS